MTQPERPRTILTPQHDGDTDEDTQQGEGDGQLEQSTEQQPSLPNHHGCAHPARAWLRRYAVPLASSLAGMCVALIALESRGRRGRRKQLPLRQGHTVTGSKESDKGPHDEEGKVRIPLRDVVRFKERQWFIEEIENCRQGDANAMLRLAKMHLHGQGCERNLPMAQEWLRKARFMGLHATIEELWAGKPEDLEHMRAVIAARVAARRAASASGAGSSRAACIHNTW